MKLVNLKESAQIIDAAGGMRVEAGQVSGDMPDTLAEHYIKTQPADWAEHKEPKPKQPKDGGK